MVRSAIERVRLCKAVKQQRSKADPLVRLLCEETLDLLKAEGIDVQDQPRADDRTAGKAAARRQMPIQDDIDPVDDDHRNEKKSHLLQNDIIFRLIEAVVLLLLLFFRAVVHAQQDQHRARGDEEHVRLAERVKSTVVQYHARDNVDRPGVLHPVLDVLPRNLIVVRVCRIADRRQIGDHIEQDRDQREHKDDGNHAVDLRERPKLPIMLDIIYVPL